MPLFGPPNVEKLKSKGDVKGLIKAMNYKKDSGVRRIAVIALGEIGGEQTVEPLITALKDSDKNVRYVATKVLEQTKDARAVEPLVTVLKDTNAEVRQAAAKALGQMGDKRTIEPLVAVLKDEVGNMQAAAKGALEQLDPNWIKSAPAKEAVPAFIAALKHRNLQVREGAAQTLGEIRDSRAVDPLAELLKDKTYKDTLEKMSKQSLRRTTAMALGKIGDARAVKPLAEALNDENNEVRQMAAQALVRVGPASIEPLITALREHGEWPVAKALGQIGDARAVKPLVATVVNTKNLRELTYPMPVEEPILALEKVLERSATEVPTEDLHKVAALEDSVFISTPPETCMYWEKTIDCSHVKQLARQELIRRGKEA